MLKIYNMNSQLIFHIFFLNVVSNWHFSFCIPLIFIYLFTDISQESFSGGYTKHLAIWQYT